MCLVYVLYFLFSVKPIITGASPEQTVISENTAMFYCNATAKPVATIRWLRDGSTLDRPQINVIYSTDGKNCNDDNPNNLCTSYSTLQIFNTQPADSGQYLCNATNDYYNDKRLVNLVVQGKHMYLSLYCIVTKSITSTS